MGQGVIHVLCTQKAVRGFEVRHDAVFCGGDEGVGVLCTRILGGLRIGMLEYWGTRIFDS